MKPDYTKSQYQDFKKPTWAPPSWLFGPVWTFLYILIAISFGYVGYLYFMGQLPFIIVLPFVLNLVFNFAYTAIQFRLRNFALAALDVLLVLATLVWAIVVAYPVAHWISYINLPYLAWVSFASVLQLTVTYLNRNHV